MRVVKVGCGTLVGVCQEFFRQTVGSNEKWEISYLASLASPILVGDRVVIPEDAGIYQHSGCTDIEIFKMRDIRWPHLLMF